MPNADAVLSGVFPVLATPFREDDSVDPVGLKRIVDLVITAGANGVVYPANASEFEALVESERRVLVEVVFTAVARRVPVIVGISATKPEMSVASARQAADHGANAVMLMPPPNLKGKATALRQLFEGVAEVVDMPIILQNAPPPLGPALSVEETLELISQVPRISYVKEETMPSGQRITRLTTDAPSNLRGVFGGAGGRYIMGELDRGAIGSMPSCECTEIHVAIYDEYRHGNRQKARETFDRILPLLNFTSIFRSSAVKEVLKQRGIIECANRRSVNNPELDAYDRKELAAIVEGIGDLWRDARAPAEKFNKRKSTSND